MERTFREPITTSRGIIRGRSAIILDDYWGDQGSMALRGTLDAQRSEAEDGEFCYTLRFFNVLALRFLELDSWLALPEAKEQISSFDRVMNSPWLEQMGGKVTADHRHYCLVTYDAAIDVVCSYFELLTFRRLAAAPKAESVVSEFSSLPVPEQATVLLDHLMAEGRHISFSTAVLLRPKMYTDGGTYEECVAFLVGYCSGAARGDYRDPRVRHWNTLVAHISDQVQTREWPLQRLRERSGDGNSALEQLLIASLEVDLSDWDTS